VQDRLLERLTGDVDLIERYIDSRCCFGRGVAHNLVQPPTQVPDLGARPEGRERAQKGLLEEILRVPVRVEAACERQQLRAVALHDRRKRTIMAAPREADEPLV
jgi:hypothetical protein